MVKLIGRDLELKRTIFLAKRKPAATILQAWHKLREFLLLDYKFMKGKSFYPSIITYEIHHGCNLSCKTCWFYGLHGAYKNDRANIPKPLDLETIKKFIDDIKSFRPYLLLTGGEPTFYPRLIEVIKYANKKGLFVGLITNGTTLDEQKIEELINSGLDFVTISLDGPEEIHNKIRGGIDGFKKAIKTIALFKEKRGRSLFPTITINLTISDYNFDNVDEMLNISSTSGADILQFQHQWFVDNPTAKAYNKWTKDNLKMNSNFMGTFETGTTRKIQTSILYRKMQQAKKNKKDVFIRVYPELNKLETEKYYAGMDPVFTRACINPWFGIIIKPNGDVVPCVDHLWGNLKEKSFKEIWNNPKATLFRQKVKDQKYFPGCTRCCGFFRKAIK